MVFILILSLQIFAGGAWQQYRDPKGKYWFLFPGQPNITKENKYLLPGKKDYTLIKQTGSNKYGNYACFIYYYPRKLVPDLKQKKILGVIDYRYAQVSADDEVLEQKEYQFHKNYTESYYQTVNNNKVFSKRRLRIVFFNRVVVVLSAEYDPNNQETVANVDKFLKSFCYRGMEK